MLWTEWETVDSGVVRAVRVWSFIVEYLLASTVRRRQRTCFTRAVSSCTRLYTDLSSRIRRAIFDVAWMTVV